MPAPMAPWLVSRSPRLFSPVPIGGHTQPKMIPMISAAKAVTIGTKRRPPKNASQLTSFAVETLVEQGRGDADDDPADHPCGVRLGRRQDRGGELAGGRQHLVLDGRAGEH